MRKVLFIFTIIYCNKTSYYCSIGDNRFCLCFPSNCSHNILSYDTNNENPRTGKSPGISSRNPRGYECPWLGTLDLKYAKKCPLLCCCKLTNYTKDFLIFQLGHPKNPLWVMPAQSLSLKSNFLKMCFLILVALSLVNSSVMISEWVYVPHILFPTYFC